MTSLSTTYLIPAILLNPAFILHLINTFVSHIMPPPHTISHSPHQFMEALGPKPGATLYYDMHTDEQLCWKYTAIMVVVQVLAFGRVQDNRDAKKSAKAAKIEREKARKEKKEEERLQALKAKANGHATIIHTDEVLDNTIEPNGNGIAKMDELILETESEDNSSVTETSEEEMIV